MKRKGCSILFVNDKGEILLFLRDQKPGLPFAGMWDILGGHVEPDEIPEDCIVREMKEEILYDLSDFSCFRIYDFDDREEHVFWKKENFDLATTILTEGQRLGWFSESDAAQLELAYGFNQVISEFFLEKPFRNVSS